MNRFCSIFSQLLQLFPRIEFQRLVKEAKAERHARGFTCWGQFVAMLFCQLGKAHSLREITGDLRNCEGYELNLKILSFMEEAEFKERGRAGKKKRIKEVEKLSAL
jgi:hypothetical protein